MLEPWKMPQIVKGMLTYVPALNAWRQHRASTGGSSSPRYCYGVWLRHLVTLRRHGFDVRGASIAELGPGDSIGTGLAALLSGAQRYVGLDIVPYSTKADLRRMLTDLAELYAAKAPIPDDREFPAVRPTLTSYSFPEFVPGGAEAISNANRLMPAIEQGLSESAEIGYHAPWDAASIVSAGSIDLVFSQAVLQYVADLESVYRLMFRWLRPGGFCSHSTGLGANNFSPFWNGHWAYTDREWRLVRGRRECIVNREPLSAHLRLAESAGFDILHVDAQHDAGGLASSDLASAFRGLDPDDLSTRGAVFILRKPEMTTH